MPKKIVFLVSLLLLVLLGNQVFAAEYNFNLSIPARQWYFSSPMDIAFDGLGNVYVIDTGNKRIQKFDVNGVFITQWGSNGSNNGQFRNPSGIAVDGSGNVFVADTNNNRIQKFDANGNYITQWGSSGTNNSQFNLPNGIVVDRSGDIYVVDTNNNRIQKFDANGVFLSKWGTSGVGNAQFNLPKGITIDSFGNIYVADTNNNRIQKFDSNSNYLKQWGVSGFGNGQFNSPSGIDIDRTGNIYVADINNKRIQKFDVNGNYLSKWGSLGSGNGQFNSPNGVAIDAIGNVYVVDTGNNRIQKFDNNGSYLAKWAASNLFSRPYGVAVGGSGNIYVADGNNNRIQKFDATGNLLTTWGSSGSSIGQFNSPRGIVVDKYENVSVVDTNNHRIQKFNSNGVFLKQWGSFGSNDGQFNFPYGIALDRSGNVYVADTYNHRVQKFNTNEVYLNKWGSNGINNGQFSYPYGVTVDASGNIYIADTNNNRIQKLAANGSYLTKWGSHGSGAGNFNSPNSVSVDGAGYILVVDSSNNRIQKFDSNGSYITDWGSLGIGDGQLNYPFGITLDELGNVYVTDKDNNRIEKYSPADNVAPSKPTINISKWIIPGQISLQLSSTDNVGVVGYYIYRNGNQIANVSNPNYNDSILPGMQNTYKVIAYDAKGNQSIVSDELTLSFKIIEKNSDVAPPIGKRIMGNTYEFISDKLFDKPVKLVFSYLDKEANGVDPNTLAVYYFNVSKGLWENIGGIVNTENKTVTVQLEHFSQYTLMGNEDIRYYIPTYKKVYSSDGLGLINKFTADGQTNYPYEIYLPNEEHPESYRIHSNYTKNTDACASCHTTHTAVGASLLQWYSVYETCMACHDGTVTTTYNVVAGLIGTNLNDPTYGGSFGLGNEPSHSNHNVTGAVKIGCQSCHSPHGQGGNARILHPDANGSATAQKQAFYFVNTTNGYVYKDAAFTQAVYILKGYPYSTIVKDENGNVITEAVIDNNAGVSKIVYSNLTAVARVEGTAAITVKMNIQNYLDRDATTSDYASEKVEYISGINTFCSACHIFSAVHRHSVGLDFNYGGEASLSYIGSDKLMPTMSGDISCLTCHFAHGTSENNWSNWLTKKGLASDFPSDLREIAGSSALKRLPNMGTCEACHQKGTANEGYAINSGTTSFNLVGTINGIFSILGANYIGSAAGNCMTCHTVEYNDWSTSSHKMIIDTGSVSILSQANANWETGPGSVKKINDAVYYSVVDVVYVVGYKKYQSYVIQDGNQLRVLPYQWVVATQSWRIENIANWSTFTYTKQCIGCHTTGYNPITGKFIEFGVACEACHGPASNHAYYSWSEKNIVSPRTLSPAFQTDLCGQCHALGRDYTYNTPYPVGYVPGEGNNLSINFEVYRSGTDSFWPDGSARSKYMEYNDFTLLKGLNHNKHYNNGMTCITCHSAHSSNSEGRMLRTPGYTICAMCHDVGADDMTNFVNSYMPYSAQSIPDNVYDIRNHSQIRNFIFPNIINNEGR